MKQHSKRTNKDYCPVCNELWEDCLCDEFYPEPKQLKKNQDLDDELYNPY